MEPRSRHDESVLRRWSLRMTWATWIWCYNSMLPSTVSSFLQRLGRTGGLAAPAYNSSQAKTTCHFRPSLVSLARRKFVEGVSASMNLPVFLHQILARVVEQTSVGGTRSGGRCRGPRLFGHRPGSLR